MAKRLIRHEGDPVLRKKAKPVTAFDARLNEQAQDLLDTLRDSGNGIGLAAPQVGLLRRLFVIDMGEDFPARVFVNPEILETWGEQTCNEGCLSIPGYFGEVRRPAKLRVRAQNTAGESFELEAEGLLAVCICHENDHLDGILFIDKLVGPLLGPQTEDAQADGGAENI